MTKNGLEFSRGFVLAASFLGALTLNTLSHGVNAPWPVVNSLQRPVTGTIIVVGSLVVASIQCWLLKRREEAWPERLQVALIGFFLYGLLLFMCVPNYMAKG